MLRVIGSPDPYEKQLESGTLAVGAYAQQTAGGWSVSKAVMSRGARRLMEGSVLIPSP